MADNVLIEKDARSTPVDGTIVAADDIAGVKYQRFKLDVGSDGVSAPFVADKSTRALTTIEYEHHEIHGGSHYFVEDVADIPINNVFDVQFTTPDTQKWGHFTFELNCEAETEWMIYEGVTVVTPGTDTVTPINNNRISTDASVMSIVSIFNTSIGHANADTVTTDALEVAHGIVGANRNGGLIERNKEIMLKQNTIYAMRAIANAAGYTNFLMSWYEHQDHPR